MVWMRRLGLPCLLAVLANCARPSPPPPPETSPGHVSPDRYLLFRDILRLYREYWFVPGKCGTPNPWLSQESLTRHTEGRLFARAYPEEAETLAFDVLRDPEAPVPDRGYAWFVLGLLPPRPNGELEAFLVEQASSTPDWGEYAPSTPALFCLAKRGLDARCLAICRAQARLGNYVAFDLLSQVVDPDSIALLREMTTWSEDHSWPIGGIPRMAEEALRRIEILRAPDLNERLRRLLLNWRTDGGRGDTFWALAVAERRGLAAFRDALEDRLKPCRAAGEPVRPRVSYPSDFDVDHILVAYHKAGGELSLDEREYLERYGILGNSEARLNARMARRVR